MCVTRTGVFAMDREAEETQYITDSPSAHTQILEVCNLFLK